MLTRSRRRAHQKRSAILPGRPLAKRLTPDSRIGFLKAISALRAINDRMASYSRSMNGNIRALGEEPAEAELKVGREEAPWLFVRPGVLANVHPPNEGLDLIGWRRAQTRALQPFILNAALTLSGR